MIRKPWKERSSELAVVRRRMRDRLFETGQIPRFVGSGDLLPWLATCLECLYNVSFLRHRCLSPSSFAHWYSHYFQLANTPSVVYPLEISLFLQFRPPSLPFLLFSFSFSLGEKRNAGFRGFFPTHNDDKQQQSCHEQRLSLRSISTSHYTPCHARGRWQLRKGIKHPLAKAPPKERGNWILRNRPRHLSCIWNFSTYLLCTSGRVQRVGTFSFSLAQRSHVSRYELREFSVSDKRGGVERVCGIIIDERRRGESRLHRWPATKIIGAANFYE